MRPVTAEGGQRRPRVAIVCPGVGLVQRGFERLFMDLFQLLEQDLDVTLFKGGGATSSREKVLPFIRRNGPWPKLLPVHKLFGRTPMHTECLSLALALLPHLRGGRYDIVHCIDPPLTRVLFKLRALLGMNFRLLYTEGCAMPPGDYPPADHIQQIAQVTYDDALAQGVPASHMTLLPCGIYPERFATERSRQDLRRAHGIGEHTFVILSVAALNRYHKRTHHLIEEAAKLQGDFLLWLDGSLDHGDPDLVELARARLGERCRISHVPSAQVGELFRLADVMVHAATFEAFGLALVEAAAAGLPVLSHDAPHFRWLLPQAGALDMTEAGGLAARLSGLMAEPAALAPLRDAETARQRFSWHALKPAYLDLYRQVLAMPQLRHPPALTEAVP